MRRYAHIFLSHLWLFALPLLVTPLLAILLIRPKPEYTATANLWVEQPAFTEVHKNFEGYSAASPAEAQANLLQEYLFSGEVSGGLYEAASKNGFLPTEASWATLINHVYGGYFQINSSGSHLITLKYADADPKLTLLILNTVLAKFSDKTKQQFTSQGEGAIKTVEDQLNQAKQDLDKAYQALRAYVLANGGTAPLLPDQNWDADISLRDKPEYISLWQIDNQYRTRYNAIKTQLDQIRVSYGAYLTGQDNILKVVDQPAITASSIPTTATRILSGLLVGVLGGSALAVLLLFGLTWTSRALQEPGQIRQVLKVERVVVLPAVQSGWGWRPRPLWGKSGRAKSARSGAYSRGRSVWGYVLLGLLFLVLSGVTGIMVAINPQLTLSLIIMTLGVTIICRWPVVGYFLCLAIVLPCELFPIELDKISSYGALALTNLNAFTPIPLSATPLEVTIVLTALAAFIHAGLQRRAFFDRSIMSIAMWLVLVFIAYGYLWGVFVKGGDAKTAQWEMRGLFYIPVIYFMTVYFLRDFRLWKPLSWLFPAGLTILGIVSTIRYLVLPLDDGFYADSLNGLNHDTAILQVLLFMWCLSKIFLGGTMAEKVTGLLLAVPTLGWIFISNRRAAFAVLAACMVVLLLVMLVRNRKAFLIFAAVLVLVVPVYVVAFSNASGPLGVAARAFSSITSDQGIRDYNSDLYRQIERTNVILTINQQPLTGIGFGQTFQVFLPMITLDGFVFQFYTPHVQVLWVWLKLGMLGWMLYWLIMCSAMFRLGQVVKYGQAGLRLNVCVLAGFIITGLMVFSYIDISLTNPRLLTLVGLGVGILELGYRTVRRPEAEMTAISDQPSAPELLAGSSR